MAGWRDWAGRWRITRAELFACIDNQAQTIADQHAAITELRSDRDQWRTAAIGLYRIITDLTTGEPGSDAAARSTFWRDQYEALATNVQGTGER